MKIIKSFLLVTVCLTAANFLQAQEVKASPTGTESNNPSQASQLKPMNGVAPTAASVAVVEPPSPLKKDENQKQINQPKKATATTDANAAENKLTSEQLNTLNGTAQRPKQTMPPATLDAQNSKPQILIAPAPAVVKEQ